MPLARFLEMLVETGRVLVAPPGADIPGAPSNPGGGRPSGARAGATSGSAEPGTSGACGRAPADSGERGRSNSREDSPSGPDPESDPDPLVAAEAEALAVLRDIDRAARLSAPLEAPTLAPATALWAARILYRGCQYVTFRHVGAEEVGLGLAEPAPGSPGPRDPAATWSADLILRYLPDLHALARGISPADPLVAGLLRLARDWPLSSVGIPGIGDADVEGILGHPSLRLLYVDRILERDDVARLEHPAVRDAVREALGAHGELSPKVARAIGPAGFGDPADQAAAGGEGPRAPPATGGTGQAPFPAAGSPPPGRARGPTP